MNFHLSHVHILFLFPFAFNFYKLDSPQQKNKRYLVIWQIHSTLPAQASGHLFDI